MSSLLKNSQANTVREALKSESEFLADEAKKNREYNKKRRERHLDHWKEEKAKVDALNADELAQYIKSASSRCDPKIGFHAMKINALEHATIKLALEISGARSSREFFVSYCNEVIKGKYK